MDRRGDGRERRAGRPTAVAASRRPPPSSTITKTKKVAAVAAVIERERGGRGERGGLDRRRRSRPTAAASTLAPYDGDRATAVTRETTAAAAAAAAVGSLEDPDAAGAGHSFPVGTMSSKDARHPSLSLSLLPLCPLLSFTSPSVRRLSVTELHEFEADGTETRSGLIESPLYVYYSFGVSPLQASELRA